MNRTIFSSSSQVLHAGGRVSTRHYVQCSSYQALLQDYKIRGSTSKPSTYTKFQEHLGTGRFREPQQRCQCTRCSKSLKQAVAGPRTIHMIVSVSVYKEGSTDSVQKGSEAKLPTSCLQQTKNTPLFSSLLSIASLLETDVLLLGDHTQAQPP